MTKPKSLPEYLSSILRYSIETHNITHTLSRKSILGKIYDVLVYTQR